MEIVRLYRRDVSGLTGLYRGVTKELQENGVHQWDWLYPNGFVIRGDVKRGTVFGIREGSGVIGAVVADDRQSRSYSCLPWGDSAGSPACIHRLAVHPSYQGKGLGTRLLRFAEQASLDQGRTSIRLDVYSGNPGAVQMYRRAGYVEVGTIRYPLRKEPYLAMEKLLL